jgi:hypothetical protein
VAVAGRAEQETTTSLGLKLEYIDYFESIERVRTQLLSPWVLGELKAWVLCPLYN